MQLHTPGAGFRTRRPPGVGRKSSGNLPPQAGCSAPLCIPGMLSPLYMGNCHFGVVKGLPTPTAQQPPLCHPPHNRQRPALPLAGRPRPASASSQPAWIYKGLFSWRLRQWQLLVFRALKFNDFEFSNAIAAVRSIATSKPITSTTAAASSSACPSPKPYQLWLVSSLQPPLTGAS